MEPHDMPFIVLGAGILWFGWFGFNAGSAGARQRRRRQRIHGHDDGCLGRGARVGVPELVVNGKPSVVGAAAGAVAGLVAITPASGYVQPMEAIAIGAIAGIVCFRVVQWRSKSALDDSLDVVGVHGIGGLWGALATGIFCVAAANTGFNARGEQVDGLTNGGGLDQLGRQAIGVAAVAPYSFIVTFIILKVLDLTVGINVDEEAEVVRSDVAEHGERGYIFGGSGPVLGIPEGIPIDVPAPAPQARRQQRPRSSHDRARTPVSQGNVEQ